MGDKKKSFVSYIDDNDETVSGYFEILDRNNSYIKIKSGKNILTIPAGRWKKIKEDIE